MQELLWDNDEATRPFAMAVDISSIGHNSISCNSGNDGSIQPTYTGGTTPYSYLWDDNAQTTDTAYDLAAGDYIVTVTDANGCTAQDTATISEPDQITGIDLVTTCESYTWVDGNTYTASNNKLLIL